MSRYSKIDRRTWNDAKFRKLSAPPPSGRYLWLFLLTNPHLTSVPGVFSAGEAMLAEALGWSVEGFREAFVECSREGLVRADWAARLVWLPNALRYNAPQSPNVVKGWRSTWDELPECALKDEAFRALKAFVRTLPKAFREAFAEAFAKMSPNQEQEQEQEQEQKQKDSSPNGAVGAGAPESESGSGEREASPSEPPPPPSRPAGPSAPSPPPAEPTPREPATSPTDAAPEAGAESRAAEVRDVFAHWAAKLCQRKPKLTDKRRQRIRARLGENYTVDELKRAVDGCAKSPYHVEGGYTDIELICRDAAKVDRFIAIAEGRVSSAPKSGPVAKPATYHGGKVQGAPSDAEFDEFVAYQKRFAPSAGAAE